MTERLTDTKIENFKKKAKRYEIRDQIVRGLLIRVGAKGEKIWEIVVSRGKSRQRIRLGTFPAMKTKDARKSAEAAKEDVFTPNITGDVKTVSDLFVRYKASKEPQMRAWRCVEGAWSNWAEKRIGHIRLTDVSIHHGLDLRDHVSGKVTAIRAGSVIRYIRPMFAWAADERIIEVNPWSGLKAEAVAVPRDRVLNAREWQSIWEASYSDNYPYGHFTRALMLSGQRLSNVAQMRWDEIEGDVWTIPRDKFKATRMEKAKAHEVPMSFALQAIIQSISKTNCFVFSLRHGKPITAGTRQKDRIAKLSDVEDWTYHDLRRTGATRMAEGRVLRFIVERVLGHADKGVTAVYDRASYREEKRQALEVLAASINDAMPDNVIGISSKAPK